MRPVGWLIRAPEFKGNYRLGPVRFHDIMRPAIDCQALRKEVTASLSWGKKASALVKTEQSPIFRRPPKTAEWLFSQTLCGKALE